MKILQSALDNIDALQVRNEYKLRVYDDEYLLPSLQFSFTVHSLPKTRISCLHDLAHRYVKRWAGLLRPSTQAVLYHPYVFAVKSVNMLYDECKVRAHIQMKVTGDEKVNAALDARLHRESHYKVKTTDHLGPERIYRHLVESEVKQEETSPKQRSDRLVRSAIKQVTAAHGELWTGHVRSHLVQSKFLDIIQLQEADLSWKSIRYQLPRVT